MGLGWGENGLGSIRYYEQYSTSWITGSAELPSVTRPGPTPVPAAFFYTKCDYTGYGGSFTHTYISSFFRDPIVSIKTNNHIVTLYNGNSCLGN